MIATEGKNTAEVESEETEGVASGKGESLGGSPAIGAGEGATRRGVDETGSGVRRGRRGGVLVGGGGEEGTGSKAARDVCSTPALRPASVGL